MGYSRLGIYSWHLLVYIYIYIKLNPNTNRNSKKKKICTFKENPKWVGSSPHKWEKFIFEKYFLLLDQHWSSHVVRVRHLFSVEFIKKYSDSSKNDPKCDSILLYKKKDISNKHKIKPFCHMTWNICMHLIH